MSIALKVPFLDLTALHAPIRSELDAAYKRVMDAGWFIAGPELEAFEREFADYCQTTYCVGVGNGLDAIHLLLRAYGIGPGDEVLVPSNTFIATWLAVTQCGATPVPVEPLRHTHNLNPSLLREKLTTRTRAIIPVHLYGQPADMDAINEVAAEHGLVVIEDAAQAQGASYKGRRVGALGHAAATSFYPGKNLGAMGDGGAVLTKDAQIAAKVRQLRNYGSDVKYQHLVQGYNSRLDEMQAAFLRVKLKALDAWNKRREAVAQQYTRGLAEVASNASSSFDLGLPVVPLGLDPVWHLYVITTSRREELALHLQNQGVQTVIHYPVPPHLQKCYEGFGDELLPIAQDLAQQVLSLPMSPALSNDQVAHVIAAVQSFAASKS